jgi:hypothetical protein
VATSVSAFIAVIPAGTPPQAMHTVNLNVGPDPVVSIHWRVPPGPRGHLGWFLAQSGVQVLPDQLGTLMVCDGEWDTWDVTGLQESGAWACVGYNTGTQDHSVMLEFSHQAAQAVLADIVEGPIPPGWPLSDADIPTAWQPV